MLKFSDQAVFKDINLGWSPAQYLLFEFADKLSTLSIRSFEVDCLLNWNHYQFTGYYAAMPAIIMMLSVFCYFIIRAKDIYMRKQEFFKQKFKLQEQVGAERRKGNDVTELQEALDGMKTTPDFVALSLGASAMIKRMDEEWTDEDGKIVRGPTEEEVAELPATAYDLAFCFSLIMLYWAWITIIKHLVQLLRTTRVDGRGWYLTTDLQIDVNTPLYNSWLIVMTAFLLAYLIAIPYSLFQSLRSENDRLHWQSIRNRLGFLYHGLRPEYYWWEFGVMARKLALVVSTSPLPEKRLTRFSSQL